MPTVPDESEAAEVPDPSREALSLLRASVDALLDPHVLVEASMDSDGEVVDFVYREVNQATCDYLGLRREELLGCGIVGTTPGVMASGLFAAAKYCLDTGEPLILDDYSYDNEILSDTRRYDVRATRATPTSIAVTWRDVTERFEAARRIAKSEEEYRLLAENVGDVVCRLRDDTIVWVSKSVEHLLGAPPEHWVGRKAADFVPAVDQAEHRARIEHLSRGGAVTGRARIAAADGTQHWVHMLVKPAIDSLGNPDGALASFRLIDDEVAYEAMLAEARELQRKSDERYRRLVDNSGVGVGLLAPDGRFQVVNQAMCDFFGYDADTLGAKTLQELTAPDYREVDQKNAEGVLTGRIQSYRMTKQYVHADGRSIWGDLSVSCLRKPTGEVESFVVQVIDITDGMELHQRLAVHDRQNRQLARRLQAQTDRLTAELRSAAAYVASILPGELTGPVRVSSRYLPSQEIAGDIFDYRWIDDEHLIVYLIDVSGHGIGPALLSVSVHNMLRCGSLPLATLLAPDMVLAELNRLFRMEQHDANYFTMWFGVYEMSSRTLRYASAGAPPAIVLSADAISTATELSSGDQPLGMFDDATFTPRSYTVLPGSSVLICSDGAYEDAGVDGRRLNRTDFSALCTRLAGSSLDDLVETLRTLTPSGSFDDDCSLIRLEFD